MADQIKFEEYRTFIEDTGRFTERRQNASNLYVSINSLLLTAIMFIAKDSGAGGLGRLILPIPIIVAGIFVSLWWMQIIKKYKTLVGHRLTILREMEDSPDLSGIEKMYHREDELYPRYPNGGILMGRGLNFSDLEARLPLVFIGLHALIGAGLLVAIIARFIP